MQDDLEIIDCGDYWTIKNHAGGYENHAHFAEIDGAEVLEKLIYKKIVPHDPYFKESARRVSVNKDYLSLF